MARYNEDFRVLQSRIYAIQIAYGKVGYGKTGRLYTHKVWQRFGQEVFRDSTTE